MIKTRHLALLGVAFVAVFAIWIPIAVSYSASLSDCNPGFGCSHGAPIETTIAIILTPGLLLLGVFIAAWASKGKASAPGAETDDHKFIQVLLSRCPSFWPLPIERSANQA